jgi:hypothetical protein
MGGGREGVVLRGAVGASTSATAVESQIRER